MTNSRFFFAVGLLSLCNAIAVGAEDCQFVFKGLLGLTVKPDDGFTCDRLTPQELFDGFEYIYYQTAADITAQQLAKPNFSVVELQSYDNPKVTITNSDMVINILHDLSMIPWKKLKLGNNIASSSIAASSMAASNVAASNSIALVPVEYEINPYLRPMTRTEFNKLVDLSGPQLEIKLQSSSVIVLFKPLLYSVHPFEYVFNSLSHARERINPLAVVVREDKQHYRTEHVASTIWDYLVKNIERSGPIRKYKASARMDIIAVLPQMVQNRKELSRQSSTSAIPLRKASKKSVVRRTTLGQTSEDNQQSAKALVSATKRRTLSQSSSEDKSHTVENMFWFDHLGFDMKESELTDITGDFCNNLYFAWSDVLLQFHLPRNQISSPHERKDRAPGTDAIVVFFPKHLDVAHIYDALSKRKPLKPTLSFVRSKRGEEIRLRQYSWEQIAKHIKPSAAEGRQEVVFWSPLDRYAAETNVRSRERALLFFDCKAAELGGNVWW